MKCRRRYREEKNEKEKRTNLSLFFVVVLKGEKDKRSVLNSLLPSTIKFEINEWHVTCSITLIYASSILINKTEDIKMT
jgi:hypothetical protein